MTKEIALIGTGAMGDAIGTRLSDTGNMFAVLDLVAERAQALVAKGAQPAGLAAKDASGTD